jgi:hypothetical protein
MLQRTQIPSSRNEDRLHQMAQSNEPHYLVFEPPKVQLYFSVLGKQLRHQFYVVNRSNKVIRYQIICEKHREFQIEFIKKVIDFRIPKYNFCDIFQSFCLS